MFIVWHYFQSPNTRAFLFLVSNAPVFLFLFGGYFSLLFLWSRVPCFDPRRGISCNALSHRRRPSLPSHTISAHPPYVADGDLDGDAGSLIPTSPVSGSYLGLGGSSNIQAKVPTLFGVLSFILVRQPQSQTQPPFGQVARCLMSDGWDGSPDPSTPRLAAGQAAGLGPRARKRKLSLGGGGGKRQRDNNDVSIRKWACFFLKWDPRQHSLCRTHKFTRVCDITQHIERQHQQPFYCPVCGITFEGKDREQNRAGHIRQQSCQKRQFKPPPGLTMDQMQALRKTTEANAPGATNVEERRWYGKYRVLFGPESLLPESPYNTDSEPGIENEIFQATCETIQSFRTQGHLRSFIQSTPSVRRHDDLEHFAIQLLGEYRAFVARSWGLEPASEHSDITATPPGDPNPPLSPSICFSTQFTLAPTASSANSIPAEPAGFSTTPVIPSQNASLISTHNLSMEQSDLHPQDFYNLSNQYHDFGYPARS